MSDLVTTLLQKKMIKRSIHSKDRRAHALGLTSKGRRLALKSVPIVEAIDAKFFSEETTCLVQLVSCLKHLI